MRDYEPYYTEDGSIGLYSHADKDVYHSKFGALTEAWEKFVLPSDIPQRLKKQNKLDVLDVCYGIGYNTKALMSFVINENKNKIKRKNFFKKIISKLNNIESIHDNKSKKNNDGLSTCIEKIDDDNNLPFINIDCIDINPEIVKLSPLFKTIKTPEEIFSNIVPDIFNCFDSYYKLKNLFTNFISRFYPKNKREIKELLEIRFKSMHIDKEYKVHPFVNYILINSLTNKFGKKYPSEKLKTIFKEKYNSKFFDKSLIKYALFNQISGYNLSSASILSTFLHNIYYRHLSNRNKKTDFKLAESLFNVNFFINDARKCVFRLNSTYDCIFLDAFTYTKAPQLWSVEFISELTKRLKDNGVILTYSNSAQVRNTFLENNLYVGKIFNEKSGKYVGTIASKDKSKITYPLDNFEMGLCNTKAGIPYHDPDLNLTKNEILELREYEFKNSNLMSSSKYIKERNSGGKYEIEEEI